MNEFTCYYLGKIRHSEGQSAEKALKKAFRSPEGWHWEPKGNYPRSPMGDARVVDSENSKVEEFTLIDNG